MSLTTTLFVVFLVLKLTGTIDWSWWWVTSPLWLPLAVVLGGVLVVGLSVVLIIALMSYVARRRLRRVQRIIDVDVLDEQG